MSNGNPDFSAATGLLPIIVVIGKFTGIDNKKKGKGGENGNLRFL